jgi:hypothetical protein
MRDEMDYPSAHAALAAPVPPSLAATVVLDEDVRAWFVERAGLAGEAGFGALVNAALREHMRRAGEPLERTLRRVLREELRKAG